jgi:hypothetical protein
MAMTPLAAFGQEKRWVNFTFDKDTPGIEYYYDRETVSYLSDNRVSVWLKIASPQGEELIHTEIECSGSMFRTIEPYKPLWEKPVKTSHAQYGWLEIPPDSEVYLLKKILCKPR